MWEARVKMVLGFRAMEVDMEQREQARDVANGPMGERSGELGLTGVARRRCICPMEGLELELVERVSR